jgi:hypothetical protein
MFYCLLEFVLSGIWRLGVSSVAELVEALVHIYFYRLCLLKRADQKKQAKPARIDAA